MEFGPFELALKGVGMVSVLYLGAAGCRGFEVAGFLRNVFQLGARVPHTLVGVRLVVLVVEDLVQLVVDVAADAVCFAERPDLRVKVVFCQAVPRIVGVFVFEYALADIGHLL